MRNILFFSILFLVGCHSFLSDVWLNRFDVCCVIRTDLLRNDTKIDFKDNFFQDKYIKLAFDYDLLAGIKIKIKTECWYISEIDWNKAYYVDEYGNKKEIVIYENLNLSNNKASNVSYISPYTDYEITLIPKDYVKNEKGVFYFRQMLDPNLDPEKLKGKNTQLHFNISCNDEVYYYTVYFNVLARYSKL